MKKILSCSLLLLCLQTVKAQSKWFSIYKDSVALVKEATKDPFVYANMQFGQFTDIYENQSIPSFNEFMKSKFK